MTLDETFALALQHHEAGRMPQAEAAYQQVLNQRPNDSHVLHMLGLLMTQLGRNVTAAEMLGRAVRISPNVADYHANFGVVLDRLGRTPDAVREFNAALALQPRDAVVLCNLGDALRRTGQPLPAIAACRLATTIDPGNAGAHNNLAKALASAGELNQAIAAYHAALRLCPDFPEARNNLGDALRRQGRSEDAMIQFRQALVHQPDDPLAHSNLGAALLEDGRPDEAAFAIRRALEIQPDLPEAHVNLGNYYLAAANNPAALNAYRRAVELKPDYALAHHQIAWTSLLMGDFQTGWREYEWRLRVNEFRIPRPQCSQPRWDGSNLDGRKILLYGEQGFGDRIQFVRYVSDVAARGGKILLACRTDLLPLYRSLGTPLELLQSGRPLPDFDVHCSLASLPLILGTTLETIPAATPYLHADKTLVQHWKTRLGAVASKLKIGLAWAGDPRNKNDLRRSIPLAGLAPLAQISGAAFFSLQKGEAAKQAQTPPPGLNITDWTVELHNFADTAALIEILDIVITVDTAIAHLAGALGKPALVLLPLACDWRWLLGRSDSPWYPSLRLFRQSRLGDWQTPVMEIVEAASAF